MKVRIISSLVLLIILSIVLLLFDTLALNLVIAFVSLLAVHELLSAVGCLQYRLLTALSLCLSHFFPLSQLFMGCL